ncbi:unnamed protein product, partial [Staurois parvus]
MMSGSDILFTTVHVISDWPISDHVNHDLTQRSYTVICVLEDTVGTRARCRTLPGRAHRQGMRRRFI